ncbi:hypothetical protein VP01_1494g2 [Puccinia sorghi]|uniref:Uncharacterized protein n=1 Tax=Puccinia sorghi TaxID=27349 RepID=A0A0L6VJX1_9BASI|nr:hypothetical protein VP01_1494g2 [Puccinia sorghi]
MVDASIVLCTCSKCSEHSLLAPNSQRIRGRYISSRNQQRHCHEDKKNRISFPEPPSNNEAQIESDEATSSSDTSTESSTSSDGSKLPISDMTTMFLCWLHLEAGVGLNKCRIARDLVLKMMLKAQGTPSDQLGDSAIPKDTRTILKRSLNVKLEMLACCPSCYKLYHLPNFPSECNYRETPRSRPCGTQLFTMKNLFAGGSHQGKFRPQTFRLKVGQAPIIHRPICSFVTQKLGPWLKWFLNIPRVESAIEDWREEVLNSPDTVTVDIQQGSAWKTLSWNHNGQASNQLDLVFSLFIDWFNPQGNKLAGKQQSVGVILMNCMNLPPTMRSQLQYTFLAGLTPGPLAPSMTTITHLLKPLVDELLTLATPFTVSTHKYLAGRTVQIRLLPLTGDMGATHKVAGFASHSATKFCSWCHVLKDEKDDLKLGQPRSGAEVRRTSENWLSSKTLTARDAIVRQNGARYSELNRLPYRDPVQHVALGMMHNWMEGVLMHHFRERWGFQTLSFKEKRRRGGNQGPSAKRPRLDTQAEDETDEDNTSSDSDDFQLNQGATGGLFSTIQMDYFRGALANVVLPTVVGCIPSQLGKSHCGKLKASQWYVLFVYVIPLIISEMFVDQIENVRVHSNRWWIMENISSLIRCTHIINARQIRPQHAERFQKSYEKYNRSSMKIFEDIKINPNHHYALHVPEQLALWGPLGGVAEWSGERCIGKLRSLETNNRLGELEGSMVKRFCQIQRLEAREDLQMFLASDIPEDGQQKIHGRPVMVDDSLYERLLTHARTIDPVVGDYRHLPHPIGARILAPKVNVQATWNCKPKVRVSVLQPNNCVVIKENGRVRYGFVKEILVYEQPTRGRMAVCLVEKITNRYCKIVDGPSKTFRFWLYLMKAVLGTINPGDVEIVPAECIDTVAAYRILPEGTFRLEQGIILTPVNHLGSLEINLV